MARVRKRLVESGMPRADLSDDQLRTIMHQMAIGFRDAAPVTAAQAATIILDGVRSGAWRILVGDDAQALDRAVRASPETAYDRSFVDALREQGYLRGSF